MRELSYSSLSACPSPARLVPCPILPVPRPVSVPAAAPATPPVARKPAPATPDPGRTAAATRPRAPSFRKTRPKYRTRSLSRPPRHADRPPGPPGRLQRRRPPQRCPAPRRRHAPRPRRPGRVPGLSRPRRRYIRSGRVTRIRTIGRPHPDAGCRDLLRPQADPLVPGKANLHQLDAWWEIVKLVNNHCDRGGTPYSTPVDHSLHHARECQVPDMYDEIAADRDAGADIGGDNGAGGSCGALRRVSGPSRRTALLRDPGPTTQAVQTPQRTAAWPFDACSLAVACGDRGASLKTPVPPAIRRAGLRTPPPYGPRHWVAPPAIRQLRLQSSDGHPTRRRAARYDPPSPGPDGALVRR